MCGDLDQTMVDMVAQRIKENGWPATAEKLDAQVINDVFYQVICILGADNGPDQASSLQRQPFHSCSHELWAPAYVRSRESAAR